MQFFENLFQAFSTSILLGIAELIGSISWLYGWVLIISILITWVQPDPYNPVVMFLRQASEPYLGWFRRRMPFLVIGAMDISPIVAIVTLQVVTNIVVRVLISLAQTT